MGFITIDAIVQDIGNGYVMDDYVMEKSVMWYTAAPIWVDSDSYRKHSISHWFNPCQGWYFPSSFLTPGYTGGYSWFDHFVVSTLDK
jgi:hypothetical protein